MSLKGTPCVTSLGTNTESMETKKVLQRAGIWYEDYILKMCRNHRKKLLTIKGRSSIRNVLVEAGTASKIVEVMAKREPKQLLKKSLRK